MLAAGLRRPLLRVGLFLVPAVAAIGVGLWAFTAVPLSNDEAATVGVASRSVGQIWDTMRHVDAVHGVYYLFMHFVVAAFGHGEVTVRLPSLVGTAIAAGLVALLGDRLQSWRAGLVAGLLFACAPAASLYAQDARPYGIVFALVVAMTMALVAALDGRHYRIMWILYAVALLVTAALHLFVVLMLPAYAIPVGLAARRQRSWRPVAWWVGASVVAIVPLIPLLKLVIDQKGTAAWIKPPGWPAVHHLATMIAGGSFLLAAGALLVGFAYTRESRLFPVAAPWLLVPPLALLAVSRFEPLFAFRYVAFSVPALALLAGASLDRLRWWLLVPVTACLIAATLPAQNSVRYHPTGASGVNDLRATAAYLAVHQRPGDGIIYTAPGQRYLAYAYPAPYERLVDVAVARSPAQSTDLTGNDIANAALPSRLAGLHRVWTVKYFIWSGGEPAYKRRESQVFAALHKAGFRWQFTARQRGTAVALWVKPSG